MCLISAAGFGVAPIFARKAYDIGLTVPMVLTVRFIIAASIFWAIVAWRRPAMPRGRLLAGCVALGAIGYAGQAACYFGSVTQIDVSLAALLLYVYPALVTVLAFALRRESPQRRTIAALICSGVGVALLLGGGATAGPVAIAGVALALGAAVIYALYLTVAAGLPMTLNVVALSAIVCTAAATTIGSVGALAGALHPPAQPVGWLWMALLATVGTAGPVGLVLAGMRLVGAPTAAILSCAEPAVAVAASAVVYSERLSVTQAVGGAVVLASVAILQVRRRPR